MPFNFKTVEEKFQKVVDHLVKDIATLRTGRATASILDPVQVEAYGSMMKLQEVASVTAPDPTLIIVAPWDKSLLEAIEKAISSSGLNLQPVVSSDSIKVAIPPLTEEKRKEMVKELHKKGEEGLVMLRTVRTDAKQEIESQEGQDGISEDDIKSDLSDLEETTKKYTEILKGKVANKEKELLTI